MYWNETLMSDGVYVVSLITTWDVLKYPLEEEIEVRLIGLITTWDVLKW